MSLCGPVSDSVGLSDLMWVYLSWSGLVEGVLRGFVQTDVFRLLWIYVSWRRPCLTCWGPVRTSVGLCVWLVVGLSELQVLSHLAWALLELFCCCKGADVGSHWAAVSSFVAVDLVWTMKCRPVWLYLSSWSEVQSCLAWWACLSCFGSVWTVVGIFPDFVGLDKLACASLS
jgi:hypothetical protein